VLRAVTYGHLAHLRKGGDQRARPPGGRLVSTISPRPRGLIADHASQEERDRRWWMGGARRSRQARWGGLVRASAENGAQPTGFQT
jgi:hypothetical protein